MGWHASRAWVDESACGDEGGMRGARLGRMRIAEVMDEN